MALELLRAKEKGFSLVDMMIVFAIAALLAAIFIPLFIKFTGRPQLPGSLALVDGLKTKAVRYYRAHDSWPASNAAIGLPRPRSITGNYVESAGLYEGLIRVDFCNIGDTNHGVPCKAARGLAGHSLLLSPLTRGGSISWVCWVDSADIVALMPVDCRQYRPPP
ncbi:MAG: pilin [Gammaproteobacteria bacterium]|nr:pilin [Gammaproteobacteria bacterium]